MKAQDLRPGMAARIDGKIMIITQFQHRTPGNLRAFMQVKLRDVKTGAQIEKRYSSSEEVDQVDLDRREIEYLYSDNTGATFMDTTNYEQSVIPTDVLGDALKYLLPNSSCLGLVLDEQVISIELPKVVELKIVDCAPGIKNATATNVMKEAKCETGLITRVPEFIAQGEKIRVSTEDGSYLSRA